MSSTSITFSTFAPETSRLLLFRVFGCLAFASTLSHSHTQFEPEVRACVFLGYPIGMKAYKLYDIQTKQIFICSDMIFHESTFPFHSESNHPIKVDPFPDLVLPLSQSKIPIPRPSPSLSSPSSLPIPSVGTTHVRKSTRVSIRP